MRSFSFASPVKPEQPEGPYVIPMQPEPPREAEVLAFLDEHGLTPGATTPLKFDEYHATLKAAHELGGRRLADWVAGVCTQTGIKYRLRLTTRFATGQSYEKSRQIWLAADHLERTQRAEAEAQAEADGPQEQGGGITISAELARRLNTLIGGAPNAGPQAPPNSPSSGRTP